MINRNEYTSQCQMGSQKVAINSKQDKESFGISPLKQLFCGGLAGSTAKTITAPLSRLTILFQVHSLITTKESKSQFASTFWIGLNTIVKRDGMIGLWKGNGTSVLHRFPFSAINFFVYEKTLYTMTTLEQSVENKGQHIWSQPETRDPSKLNRIVSGATAGSVACILCYPLDLVRTRLTTDFSGQEKYRGISDAVHKIIKFEGIFGLYSGLIPTLFVAVPNFSISYTAFGSLKEYVLNNDIFISLQKVDNESGEKKLGFYLTLMCGAVSGMLAALVTYPFDTIRRRMQVERLHISCEQKLNVRYQFLNLYRKEGCKGLYRGLTPELIKVVPMVGTLFLVYEFLKEKLRFIPKV